MTMGFILRTIAEVAVVAFLIWGFLHEDKFIRFEDRLARIVAVNIRRLRQRRKLKKQGAVTPAPAPKAAHSQQSYAYTPKKTPAASSAQPLSRPAKRRRKRLPPNAA